MPGIAVDFNTNTVLEGGTAADLSNGVLVLAKDLFDRTTHAVKATWIEIVRDDAKQPRVSEPVGDFVSASDFRVGGQKVDASQATLVDGEETNLGTGAIVEAIGSLHDVAGTRVLVATKLRFLVK